MNHKEAVSKNSAELYFKRELTPEEETAFEEHLLWCPECRDRVKMLEDTLEEIEIGQKLDFREGANKRTGKEFRAKQGIYYLRIAAGIILLLSITALAYFIVNERKLIRQLPAASDNSNDTLVKTREDRIPEPAKQDTDIYEKAKREPVHLAKNFVPDLFYERLVEEKYRNAGLIILEPLADTLTRIPVFKWRGAFPETLFLKILDNRAREVFEGSLDNGKLPPVSLNPGLYYWQLQDENETLYTGRFTYLPPSGR